MFGLLYMRGLLGANLIDAKQLWTSNYSPVFAAAMSYNRFCFLLSHLRLDDASLRREARLHDKFAAARQILDLFNLQLAKAMQCGALLCFDESLYPNRGNGYGFRQVYTYIFTIIHDRTQTTSLLKGNIPILLCPPPPPSMC